MLKHTHTNVTLKSIKKKRRDLEKAAGLKLAFLFLLIRIFFYCKIQFCEKSQTFYIYMYMYIYVIKILYIYM